MTGKQEDFYFYSYYSFLGRVAYAKCRGEPVTTSVNGGGKRRIISKYFITEEQFDNVDIVTLKQIFFPDEVKHAN